MWHIFGTKQVLASPAWLAAKGQMASLAVEYTATATTDEESLRREVGNAQATGARKFVAIGGDGSANYLLNALIRAGEVDSAVLGLLPCGTGCDFARNFGIPKNVVDAVNVLAKGRPQSCDVGLITGDWGERYFLNVASIGLTAAAVQSAECYRILGRARYLLALAIAQCRFPALRYTLTTRLDSQAFHGMLAIVGNGKFFGGGFAVNPESDTNDGQFEVISFTGKRRDLPLAVLRARQGRHVQMKQVDAFSTDVVTVQCAQPTPVEADGEYLGTTPIEVRVLPDAIRVQTP